MTITQTSESRQSTNETQPPTAGLGPILDNPTLSTIAETVDDLEGVRKAMENRIRQITNDQIDSDGVLRGLAEPENSPTVVSLRVSLDEITKAEKEAVRNLEKVMKNHPLGPWIKEQNGLGLKTVARLLAAVGDPYWNTLYGRPRTVSELWAYCGLAVRPDGCIQRRQKGQKSNWSDTAKMRVWNIVQPIIKNRNSPYRHLYDQVKEGYQGRVYDERYAGRKLKGATIVAGDPIPAGHINAMTERIVMKAILKDLWIESKRLHEKATNG